MVRQRPRRVTTVTDMNEHGPSVRDVAAAQPEQLFGFLFGPVQFADYGAELTSGAVGVLDWVEVLPVAVLEDDAEVEIAERVDHGVEVGAEHGHAGNPQRPGRVGVALLEANGITATATSISSVQGGQ